MKGAHRRSSASFCLSSLEFLLEAVNIDAFETETMWNLPILGIPTAAMIGPPLHSPIVHNTGTYGGRGARDVFKPTVFTFSL